MSKKVKVKSIAGLGIGLYKGVRYIAKGCVSPTVEGRYTVKIEPKHFMPDDVDLAVQIDGLGYDETKELLLAFKGVGGQIW